MPMKNFEHSNEHPLQGEAIKFYYLNKIIDYCNELERRLAEVEKPVERIKSETRSTGEYEPQTLQEDAEEDERLAKCCKSKIIKS